MEVAIETSWKNKLESEFKQPYFASLVDFVRQEYQNQEVYPPGKLIFNAFDKCAFEDVKVVIIGQDPYHGVGQANGLCFSVAPGIRKPPSLLNIFKELESDIGKPIPESGDLSGWADQGVLLLNATLTVRAATPGAHQNQGWEQFTDAVIELINHAKKDVVFILWGAYAQKKGSLIDAHRHHIIASAHPSPFAAHRGFFGSKPFSRTNTYLISKGLLPVQW